MAFVLNYLEFKVNEEEQKLLSLPRDLEESKSHRIGSNRIWKLKKVHQEIANNDITNNDNGEDGKTQQQIKSERRQQNNATLDELRVNMTPDKKLQHGNGIIKLADVPSNQRSWLPSEQGAILGRYSDQIRLDSTTSTNLLRMWNEIHDLPRAFL